MTCEIVVASSQRVVLNTIHVWDIRLGLFTGKLMGSDRRVYNQWNIGAFLILLIWCISQNILVEMFLYYDQLAVGKDLSWAPLAPTGPWMNPVLFQYGDRTITLHGQVPWLLMTPILYFITMHFGRKE